MTVDFLKEKSISYDRFRLEINCITFVNTFSIYLTNNGKEDKLILSVLEQFDFSPATNFYCIKINMYNQAPEEGAILNCRLIVDKDNNYEFFLNYDDKEHFYEQNISNEHLVNEFKKFPRKIDFTPIWWKGILGKNANYLG